MRAKRLIPLLAALLLLAACGLIAEDQEAAGGDLIYYLAEEASGSDAIRAEAADLGLPEGASLQERAEAVVERLIAGPEAGNLASPKMDSSGISSTTCLSFFAFLNVTTPPTPI